MSWAYGSLRTGTVLNLRYIRCVAMGTINVRMKRIEREQQKKSAERDVV